MPGFQVSAEGTPGFVRHFFEESFCQFFVGF
jgi:hypothetical protein